MRFNFMKKDYYICPYCFSKHDLKEVNFLCGNDPQVCKNAKNRIPIEPRKVDDKNEMLDYVFCNECGKETNIKICPTCKSELPYSIGEYDNLIFTVIGAKGAGKSHYISVLINKIMNEMSSTFNYSFSAVNDDTINKYRRDFYNPVFRRGETIGKTQSAKVDSSVKQPLIYNFNFKGNNIVENFLKSKLKNNAATIAFFDTCGDDLNSEDDMKTLSKYIYNSSGIIFLIDPLQMKNVRQKLSKDIELQDENEEVEDLLSRMVNLIRKENGIKINSPIDIPVAVAISKIDTAATLIDESKFINYLGSRVNKGYFDLSDFEDINKTVESLLRSWGGENFVNQLNSNFKDYAYFALSALGSNPENNKISEITPSRVEDPFLWLLYKYKLINGKKRK